MFLMSLMYALLAGCPAADSVATTTGAESSGTGLATGVDGTVAPPPPPSPESSPAFVVVPGEGVKVSGTVGYAGTSEGKFHVDFVEPPQPGHYPKLVHSVLVESAGAWELEVPKNYGKVGVMAYLDIAGDGPTPTDPAARVAALLEIGETEISGLVLNCVENADLGELTPGVQAGPAPAGTDAPGGVGDGTAGTGTTTAEVPSGGEAAVLPGGGATPSSGSAEPL